jgi:SH3-like domain-containing protein
MHRAILTLPLALLLSLAGAASAQQNREVPYWASLRAGEVNMRVGPSSDFPISWVYKRAGLPVKVIRVNQGWRLIEDPDGARGWVVARLLTPERAALVVGKGMAELRAEGSSEGKVLWQAEPGVVGALGDCKTGWCKLSVGDRKGWVRSTRLWGPGEP